MSLVSAFIKAPSWGSFLSVLLSVRSGAVTHDIRYGEHKRQRFDIYAPPESKPVKARIFFLYGGGWTSGERQIYGFVGKALSARGYLTIIPDYRLFPEVRYPEFILDVAQAYSVAMQCETTAIEDEIPTVLMGHSAGAYMAALLCYHKEFSSIFENDTHNPKGLIAMSGPYGINPKDYDATREIFSTLENGEQIKPTNYLSSQSPPALFFHGKNDEFVLPLNAEVMAKGLLEVDVYSDIIELKKTGHVGPLLSFGWPFKHHRKVMNAIDRFVLSL